MEWEGVGKAGMVETRAEKTTTTIRKCRVGSAAAVRDEPDGCSALPTNGCFTDRRKYVRTGAMQLSEMACAFRGGRAGT